MLSEQFRNLESLKLLDWREGDGQFSPDYYLRYPAQQPKLEIGNYVESQGILVPRRFASLDEALASNRPFIVRSEHPQDYAGASGLVESHIVSQEIITEAREEYDPSEEVDFSVRLKRNLKGYQYHSADHTIAQIGHVSQDEFERNLVRDRERYVDRYCNILGIDPNEFKSQFSFSYWELIKGFNRTIIADNAISGRYHLFTKGEAVDTENGFRTIPRGYIVIENGEKVAGMSRHIPESIDNDFQRIIQDYEAIRKLGRFDPNHCPFIEMQTGDEGNYFLQYHRGRNSSPSTFTLDRNAEKGEYQPLYVRGATPPDGIEVEVGVNWEEENPVAPEGGIDYVYGPLTESQVRTRRLQMRRVHDHPAYIFLVDEGHLPRSELFKPEVSVLLEREDCIKLLDGVEYSKENPNPTLKVKVTSDGRKAFVQRI